MISLDAQNLQRVYEKAKEYVGYSQTISLGVLTPRDLQRFAMAVGDLAPEYADEQAAQAAGYSGQVAPPLYLSAVLGWHAGPAERHLLPDGSATEALGSVPLADLRLMGGGQALRFFEPVLAGTEITMELVVENLELRQGRSGPLLLLVVLRRYLDDLGCLLVECRETFIAR